MTTNKENKTTNRKDFWGPKGRRMDRLNRGGFGGGGAGKGGGIPKKYIVGGAAAAVFFSGLFFVLISVAGDGAGRRPAPSPASTSVASTVILPDLINKTVDEARHLLQQSGLRANARSENSDLPAGTVVRQFPEPKIAVDKNQVVELTVSSGPSVKQTAVKAGGATSDSEAKKGGTTIKMSTAPARTAGKILSGFTVVLDPGHQLHGDSGLEPIGPGSTTTKAKVTQGATGVSTRIPEYQFTLKLAKSIERLLIAQGATVVLTRDRNDIKVSNIQRAEIGNTAKADLVVRLHADGNTDRSVAGISTLYPGNNQWTGSIAQPSLRAAQVIQGELAAATGRPDRGAKPRTDLTGFNWSKVPVVLAEVGFLSNPAEDRLLNSAAEQDRLAKAIASGVRKYLKATP